MFLSYVWLPDFSLQKASDMLHQFETLTIENFPYLFKRIKEQVLHLNWANVQLYAYLSGPSFHLWIWLRGSHFCFGVNFTCKPQLKFAGFVFKICFHLLALILALNRLWKSHPKYLPLGLATLKTTATRNAIIINHRRLLSVMNFNEYRGTQTTWNTRTTWIMHDFKPFIIPPRGL